MSSPDQMLSGQILLKLRKYEFWIQNIKTPLWQQAVARAQMNNDPGSLAESLLFW
jgi:hypothetical protein